MDGCESWTIKKAESENEVSQSCPTFCDRWTVAHQAPPSMGFSKQEYWSGLPFPSPGDLPGPGIELVYPALAHGFFPFEPPEKPMCTIIVSYGVVSLSPKPPELHLFIPLSSLISGDH